VVLTLLSRVAFRSAAIIAINAASELPLSAYLNTYSGADPFICTYDLGYVFSIVFFTLALLLNAVRWMDMIRKLTGRHNEGRVRVFLRRLNLTLIAVFSLSSGVRMYAECINEDKYFT
jgi:predicted PurR-regulated permease PerM